MENRNLDKALELASKLIVGEEVSHNGQNVALYEAYNTNSEVYDILHMFLKKMNLKLYEYNYSLFVCSGENNRVFGYTNEELKRIIGVRVNKELFLCYFIIYNIIMAFYNDSNNFNYAEYTKIEDVIALVDASMLRILDKSEALIVDELDENSFKAFALLWEELLPLSADDAAMRAAKNSKAGYVKMVFNFLISQNLFVEIEERYYPKDRFKAMAENYFNDFKGRLHEILSEGGNADATD
ncbi:MAG: hypothetical protein IKL73_05825 [Lachnospiraceae bacterium]|nr:hypothetical protein [Lachnospira sp.]MBR6697771.1 hypothetical protein [Lachnospiraceae bacterium]